LTFFLQFGPFPTDTSTYCKLQLEASLQYWIALFSGFHSKSQDKADFNFCHCWWKTREQG